MEGEYSSPLSTWECAVRVCKEVQEAELGKRRSSVPGGSAFEVLWRKSGEGWAKINIDEGKMGVDGSGLVLFAGTVEESYCIVRRYNRRQIESQGWLRR